MNEINIIDAIKNYYANNNKIPTIRDFSKVHNINPASIIKQFGSWNDLLYKAGLKYNKSTKRTDEQLLLWLKAHPNAKYYDIPSGIRSSIEERFGSITNARYKANLKITDWRAVSKRKYKKIPNAGRPIEYSKESIIVGLRSLAISLGRPPRMKDIKKSTCGFPISAVLSRFQTFNKALQAAELPPVYSYHEFSKLEYELEKLLINIKIATNNIPLLYDMQINDLKPKFIYDDHFEEIKLTRNDIHTSMPSLLKYKQQKPLIVYYLVDDSLYENDDIQMICIMDFINKLSNQIIINKINELRLKYDEINRKYLWEKELIKMKQK